MALFTQSTKTVSAVVQEIADSAGASGDTDMTTRAGRSLNAGIERFNTRADWDFMLVEAPLMTLVAPFTVTGVIVSAAQSSATVPVAHGILVDDVLGGVFAGVGGRVTATAATSFGFDSLTDATIGTASATASIVRDMYTLPADYRKFYSDRLEGVQSSLRMVRRRMYNRSIRSEFTPSTPVGYDLFPVAAKGKFRVLPPPAAADSFRLYYYRRMTTLTATAATDLLDIPQDYEPYLIAWGKWHFLTDKGEGRMEQAKTWIAFADDGIKTMLSDQTRAPDEDLMFVPGHYTYNPAWGPNSVGWQLDQGW